MKKECIAALLPTERSNIFISKNGLLWLNKSGTVNSNDRRTAQHLYICSTDEIKEGYWMYDPHNKYIERCTAINFMPEYGWLKIVATTDSLVIGWTEATHPTQDNERAIYLSSIPQSFIQQYIDAYKEGDKIEKVMVEYESERYELLNQKKLPERYAPSLNDNEIIISFG